MTDARSIISETSTTEHVTANILDDIEDFELQQRLEKLEREITALTFENALFESNLERKKFDPVSHHISSMVPPQTASSFTTTTPSENVHEAPTSSAANRNDRLARKRSRSRSTQADFRIQLTIGQKLDIIISEYEHTKNEKHRQEMNYEKDFDQLEADLEWIDNEITDLELSTANFLKTKASSIDKNSKKLVAEKLIHYFNERLKGHESLINKLRDRSLGFKRQIIRLDIQLKQNEETGDTLQEIDFQQLKIENKQYLDKIDEKNLELVLLKRQVAKFNQTLNNYKDRLEMATRDFLDIQKRIDKQNMLFEYTQRELLAANYEQNRASKKHSQLVEQTESYRVPEILDYVRQKALFYNLQRDCEVWQRKVELVTMGFQQSKQKWQAIQRNARYMNNMINYNNELQRR